MTRQIPALALLVAAVATASLTACGGEQLSGPPDDGSTTSASPSATSTSSSSSSPESTGAALTIPEDWLSQTAAGWPDSDGFGAAAPVLDLRTDCLLFDAAPGLLGEESEGRGAGWGAYGSDPADQESYRYLCRYGASGRYAGEVQLLQATSADDLAETLDLFVTRPSSDVQEVTASRETVDGTTLDVLATWYPTNPQGKYEVFLPSEDQLAGVVLEVNSLSREDFDALGPEGAARALVDLVEAHSA
ncbi:hypothetical protein C8046_00540 [Serinibacter arcticus]|uniref:Uncharacterized protein n=1 Tax=Serinibacter arcticus TaxID=1655435 RepID=A0A2U1ZR60_9MICO|nr:hypothetical protein [Serinibacter arcticus]PWD49430.1 hypothetical protein C8046_00540 [Serinibacter arcticus]